MTIRERTRYPLPAEDVWPYLVRPDVFAQWNPKIRKVSARGDFVAGDEYWTEYRMSGKTTVCKTVVSVVDPPRSLVLEHRQCQNETGVSSMTVDESFTLIPGQGWTELRHVVHIKNHGMNPFVVILFWLVTTFGKSVEADALEGLIDRDTRARLGQLLK